MPGARTPTALLDLVPLRALGGGHSSRVLLCEKDGQRFALKVARATDVDPRALFANEARCLAWARSRTLPTLHAAGSLPRKLDCDGESFAKKAPYLLLGLAEGRPLTEWFGDAHDSEALAWAVARDVSEALSDLHAAGFAHGDVKPDNIIARDTGAGFECTLIDLGLADVALREKPKGGTRRYLAPETWDENATGNAISRDLFALGMCLLETLVPEARRDVQATRRTGELPESIRPLIEALLAPNPASRPLASWIHGQCGGSARRDADVDPARATRASARVERSYLLQRRQELSFIERGHRIEIDMPGTAGRWLEKQKQVLEQIRDLLDIASGDEVRRLASLTEHQQRRWLVSLIGVDSIDFPALPGWDDDALASRLLGLVREIEPESITFGALIGGSVSTRVEGPTDPIDVALGLGVEMPDDGVLARVEVLAKQGEASHAMVLRAARVLKRKNEIARALTLLSRFDDAGATLERAGILLRVGDFFAAEACLSALDVSTLEQELRATHAAMRARMALAKNDPDAARAALSDAAPGVLTKEAWASLYLTLGELPKAQSQLEQALSYPHDAEQRARIEALFANLAQHQGDSEGALKRFRSAAEHAARASAFMEEATYLIGVASTAANVGALELALSASRRSELLFGHLQKPSAAARAALSSAAAYATANAKLEAEQACHRTLQLAREAGDDRCRGYAHLVASDVAESGRALEHLERAAQLLEPLRPDDELRIAARLLRLEAPLSKSVSEFDRMVPSVALDGQLEWWAARAEHALSTHQFDKSASLLESLTLLSHRNAAPDALGPAMAFGAQLAAEQGDGELARRFLHVANEALRKLTAGTPQTLRLPLAQKAWVKLVRSPTESSVSKEQLGDLEMLIHALSDRERLKPLFERVLDALVLWTGVERGLLLLRAPGGKLVPRAARNIARRELNPLQVELSRSLAERAMERSECVVAVDAEGELPDLYESVHALKLRSILAVPLLARGEALGVVYLDDRIRRGAFGPRELSWVRLVAALASVAIADAKAQSSLRRTAHRAARAERHLARALAERDAQLEVAERELAKSRDQNRFAYPEIVGTSTRIKAMLTLLDRITPSEVPVLIFGESGSGKELVARAIAKNGPRGKRPFVSENCSAIPETLLESTLFGHVKGAFTGAARQRIGLFEAADGGTLFLDEIADMSLSMQAKLLRALENGEIRRVGDEHPVTVNVRVIGATHKDLGELVRDGAFREDLLYRLNVISVSVPALRERSEDIPALVEHFVAKHGAERAVRLSKAAIELLCGFSWPGNVRQLENETRRAMVLADDEIRPEHFSPEVQLAQPRPLTDGLNLRQRVDALEAQLVAKALCETGGNQTRASKLLGVSRFGLQKMMRRLGIDAESAATPR